MPFSPGRQVSKSNSCGISQTSALVSLSFPFFFIPPLKKKKNKKAYRRINAKSTYTTASLFFYLKEKVGLKTQECEARVLDMRVRLIKQLRRIPVKKKAKWNKKNIRALKNDQVIIKSINQFDNKIDLLLSLLAPPCRGRGAAPESLVLDRARIQNEKRHLKVDRNMCYKQLDETGNFAQQSMCKGAKSR